MESYDLFSLGILNSETVRGTSNFTQFLKASEKKKEKNFAVWLTIDFPLVWPDF